jgi:hypothetical protein
LVNPHRTKRGRLGDWGTKEFYKLIGVAELMYEREHPTFLNGSKVLVVNLLFRKALELLSGRLNKKWDAPCMKPVVGVIHEFSNAVNHRGNHT